MKLTPEQQELALEASRLAISKLLQRIREDERVRFLLGVGTRSYEQLTDAASKLWLEDVDKLRDSFIPGSAAIHRPRKSAPSVKSADQEIGGAQ